MTDSEFRYGIGTPEIDDWRGSEKKYFEFCQESPFGWIDRKGKWWGCTECDHYFVAMYLGFGKKSNHSNTLLRECADEALKAGWVMVNGDEYTFDHLRRGLRMTPSQKRRLVQRGHGIRKEDL